MTQYERFLDLLPHADERILLGKLTRMAGYAAEDVAMNALKAEGYEVDQLSSYAKPISGDIEINEEAEEIIEHPGRHSNPSDWPQTALSESLVKVEGFSNFCEDVQAYWDASRSDPIPDRGTIPDFVAFKDGRVFIIESKSGDGKLETHQREVMRIGERYGFAPLMVRILLSVRIEKLGLFKVVNP